MSKTIYWHIQDFKNLPKNDNWLSEREKEIQDNMRFAKRRSEWRLGRWVVKNALLRYLSIPLSEIEVLSHENGAPKLIIKRKTNKLALSISHRENKAICAFSEHFDFIGCDLEFIEPRSTLFINDYFTPDEINYIDLHTQDKDLLANLIWSAKESVTKVLQSGLNLDTREINVHRITLPHDQLWGDLEMVLKNKSIFKGSWRTIHPYIITLSADSIFDKPVQI